VSRSATALAQLTDEQLKTLRESLRKSVGDESSLEEASQTFVQNLYEELAGGAALVRMYVTLPAAKLPPAERAFAERVARQGRGPSSVGDGPDLVADETRVLTLLGTYGVVPSWCDRRSSRGHRAIPLLDAGFVDSLPMIARLLAELGVDLGGLADSAIFARRLIGGYIGVFHVEDAAVAVDAQGRNIIPAADFIAEHGIRTVFGMGTAFLDGSVAACIVFARELMTRTQAERFGGLMSHFRLVTRALLRDGALFRP
jgi:hypothetical protein